MKKTMFLACLLQVVVLRDLVRRGCARGLIALAFTLGDEDLKARACKWVDAVLASQKEDGDFGPRKDNWWANMIPLWYLRDWADATGDGRIVPFLERYYRYQREEFKTCTFENELKPIRAALAKLR